MATYTKEQVIEIINKAPAGTSPSGIVAALREGGNTLEGYPSEPTKKRSTLSKIGSFLGEAVFGTAAKTIASVAEIPEIALKGRATGRTIDLPGLAPFQTFQTEAQARGERIVEGEQPLWHALSPFVEVPFAVAETVGLGAGLAKGAREVQKLGVKEFAKQKARSAIKKVDDAVELTRKKLTVKGKEAALRAGKATTRGLKKEVIVNVSKRDKEIAETVKDLVNKKNHPVKNINNVLDNIQDISENQVRPRLQSITTPVNKAELLKRIDKAEMSIITDASPSTTRIFNKFKDRMKGLVNEADSYEDLWSKRIDFDRITKAEKPKIFDNALKGAVDDANITVRKVVNEFIGETQPLFKEQMSTLNKMYEAVGNMSFRHRTLVGSDNIKRLIKRFPWIRRMIEIGIVGKVID